MRDGLCGTPLSPQVDDHSKEGKAFLGGRGDVLVSALLSSEELPVLNSDIYHNSRVLQEAVRGGVISPLQ